jgi:hypothetical protein
VGKSPDTPEVAFTNIQTKAKAANILVIVYPPDGHSEFVFIGRRMDVNQGALLPARSASPGT